MTLLIATLLTSYVAFSTWSNAATDIISYPPAPEILLYHGYGAVIQSEISLTYHPQQHRLEQRKKDSHGKITTVIIPLSTEMESIDSGVLSDSGHPIISGLTQGQAGFVAGLDLQGYTIWRYPSPRVNSEDRYRFYSLAWGQGQTNNKRPDSDILADNRQRLFLAGTKNNYGSLWVIDFNDDQVDRLLFLSQQKPDEVERFSDNYQQVISFSESEIVALNYSRQRVPQYRLDKWFNIHQQWQYQTLDCPFCLPQSPSEDIIAVALKSHEKDRFFLITSSSNRLNISLMGAWSGDPLDTLSLDISNKMALNWNSVSVVDTPVFLSKSAAISVGQSQSHTIDKGREILSKVIADLSATPRLVIVNRGGLLGISGQSTRSLPLVIDLHKNAFLSADNYEKDRAEDTPQHSEPEKWRLNNWVYQGIHKLTDMQVGSFSCWLAVSQVALIVVMLNRNQLYGFGRDCYHKLYQCFFDNPEKRMTLETLRQQRMACFQRDHSPVSLNHLTLSPEQKNIHLSPDVPGSSITAAVPVPMNPETKVEKNLRQFQQQLKKHLGSAIKSQQCNAENAEDHLTTALLKVLLQKQIGFIRHKQTPLPEGFTLNPMPADQYCFYHAIGQALGMDGQSFFQALTQTAQNLLQDSAELTALTSHFGDTDGVIEEIAAMSHVQAVNQGQADRQIWGHVGLLPFICWYLELSVIVVTPGTWSDDAGALYFMSDGEWELIDGSGTEVAQTLLDMYQDNPQLLIMQHNGFSHWDVVKVDALERPH